MSAPATELEVFEVRVRNNGSGHQNNELTPVVRAAREPPWDRNLKPNVVRKILFLDQGFTPGILLDTDFPTN